MKKPALPSLTLCLSLLLGACGPEDEPWEQATQEAITGGLPAPLPQYPATGFLTHPNDPTMRWCIATRIRRDVVITAAHCVAGTNPITQRFGYGDHPDKATIQDIVRIASYPGVNDIALMQTETCEAPTAVAEIADLPEGLLASERAIPLISWVSYLHTSEGTNGPRTKLLADPASNPPDRLFTSNSCAQGRMWGGDSGAPGYLTGTNKLVVIVRAITANCSYGQTQGLYGYKPAYGPVKAWIDETLAQWELPAHPSCSSADLAGRAN